MISDRAIGAPAWLTVIGIGEDGMIGLAPRARALIDRAELLVGGARHLAMMPNCGAERLVWDRPLLRTIERIADWRGRAVVVLASGDPLWYGVGVTLTRHFSASEMLLLPSPGAFSLAAARLAWSLASCETLTLHGRPLERLALHLAPEQRVLALSEDGTTPAKVAAFLTRLGWGPSDMTVLEHLGGEREAVWSARADRFPADRVTADLNTLAVICRPAPGSVARSHAPGLPDEVFRHDGQLTKREVRSVTLANLGPLPGALLWDVGAGCGSIAIEWCRAARGATAIAVERDPARCGMIAENAAALGVPELRIVEAAAPAALDGLPRPDAVFIGGGVSRTELLERCWAVLAPDGRMVANAVTVQGERALLEFQAAVGGALTRLAVSRAEAVGGLLGWRPLMPVTQLALRKGHHP